MKKYFTIATLCLAAPFFIVGCASSPKNPNLPSESESENYKINGYLVVDGIDKDTVSLKLDKEDKIAVVVRDISTTSYSYLEPRYHNTFVNYEGKASCCMPKNGLIGASGSSVYKFSFIGKGKTTIKLIKRQKGLLTTAVSFDTDEVFNINVEVD
ncbi:hypothetical protein [Fluviispira multicolorata]|uniref:Lipoprotein n=1 Tax=Fluviispira multicolorata TaxID=2654512 RepID=A0A833JCT4_9BACT|nr:hypothetical protein [Fluviispira multicolorata]KAB8030747.1 hypothetical protein GCL57_07175 [Fluviispira multicolorata]